MLERIPCNIEAEESILGAMLYSHAAIPSAQALLVPEDFYHEGHRVIYRALLELYAEGKPTDHTVLVDRLKKSGQLDMVGDRAYLLSLEDTCPNPNNAKHYASLVKEAALRRQLADAGYSIANVAHMESDDVRISPSAPLFAPVSELEDEFGSNPNAL